MARYTYLACDLLTNEVIEELPLSGVDFTRALNGAGDLNANLPLSDKRVQKLNWETATSPSRTALYVDRDGVLVWGGILWTRRYADDEARLYLTGAEFWSYFHHRLILADTTFSQVDQFTIVKTLIDNAQARPSGNIGVDTSAIGTCGVLRDRSYWGYERAYVGDRVEELSQVIDGFDFRIDVGYDSNGLPAKKLILGYPRLGRTVANTGHVFDRPGNIITYSWDEDGTEQADAMYAVGEGEGDSALQSSAVEQSLLDAGYPLLEAANTYSDVSEQNTLDGHARDDLRSARYPVVVPQITVRADMDPRLGEYVPGDDARVLITDKRFPSGYDAFSRITSFKVTAPDSDTSESVQVDVQEAI